MEINGVVDVGLDVLGRVGGWNCGWSVRFRYQPA
jgi:hypothetical protein